MGRIIGIQHRVKRTVEGEARPTKIAIFDGDPRALDGTFMVRRYDLEDETAELDFLMGRQPVKWGPYEAKDSPDYQLRFCKSRVGADGVELFSAPIIYEGLQSGDTVAMILGGSGDRFAAALSRRGEEIGAAVFRIPSFIFKEKREEAKKEEDALRLAVLVADKPELFYRLGPRDRDHIRVREALFARQEAQKARIGCGQRLLQRIIGKVFLSEEGHYPEGRIEDEYDRRQATNVIFQSLLQEEKEAENELRKAVRDLDVWSEVFEPIEGCGEVLAAKLIAPIGDIRKFATAAKLKAFCGVHVLSDGRFPRRRHGEVSNWSPMARQALYLLGDQFNKRPSSVWGMKLREYKTKLRGKHPQVVEEKVKRDGKMVTVKRFSDGHIHKMALWRTLTKFAEWLYREWMKLEERQRAPVLVK